MLSSEYGYTFEQFGNLTTRQIHIALKNISSRKENDIRLQAKLHGAEYKEREKVASFTKNQDEELVRQMERIKKEKFGNAI